MRCICLHRIGVSVLSTDSFNKCVTLPRIWYLPASSSQTSKSFSRHAALSVGAFLLFKESYLGTTPLFTSTTFSCSYCALRSSVCFFPPVNHIIVLLFEEANCQFVQHSFHFSPVATTEPQRRSSLRRSNSFLVVSALHPTTFFASPTLFDRIRCSSSHALIQDPWVSQTTPIALDAHIPAHLQHPIGEVTLPGSVILCSRCSPMFVLCQRCLESVVCLLFASTQLKPKHTPGTFA